MITAMYEEMRVGLSVVDPSVNEIGMLARNSGFLVEPGVRIESFFAAAEEPVVRLRTAFQKVEHHFFMIAHERHQPATLAQRQQFDDDFAAVGAAVDAIA